MCAREKNDFSLTRQEREYRKSSNISCDCCSHSHKVLGGTCDAYFLLIGRETCITYNTYSDLSLCKYSGSVDFQYQKVVRHNLKVLNFQHVCFIQNL